MLGSVFNRANSMTVNTDRGTPPLRRMSSDADGSTLFSSSSVQGDCARTPKARRKSDIHELLPEMLLRHDSDGGSFRLVGPGETVSDFYAMDVAFYSVGAKSVTKCTELASGKSFVMKRRARDANGCDAERPWRRVMEKLLRSERDRHIVAFHEILEDDAAFYIVMEECDGGQLFDLLLRESSMSTRECKRIVREILLAVEYLHDHGLLHRDIKPENIMLSKENGENVIKLIDFDTCDEIAPRRLSLAMTPSDRVLKRRSTRVIGTLGYIAPESFSGEYSTASDLFSVGVIFFILMTGDMPFDDAIYHSFAAPEGEDDDIQLVGSPRAKRVSKTLAASQIDWTMNPWPQLPMARDLCQRLLATDPEARLKSCEQALSHPWLASAALQSVPATPAKRN